MLKNIVITGALSGIGAELTRLYGVPPAALRFYTVRTLILG
jgi:hypothetical protein